MVALQGEDPSEVASTGRVGVGDSERFGLASGKEYRTPLSSYKPHRHLQPDEGPTFVTSPSKLQRWKALTWTLPDSHFKAT